MLPCFQLRFVSKMAAFIGFGLCIVASAQTIPAGKRELWTATNSVAGEVASMTMGDDYNGDGVRDFIVRQQAVGIAQFATTAIEWVSGVNGSVIRSFTPGGGSLLGRVITPCDDLDQDGMNDVLVSNTPSLNSLVPGPSTGADIVALSSASATQIFVLQLSPLANSVIGITSVADIDGDTRDEFLVTTIFPNGFVDRSLRFGLAGGLVWTASWTPEAGLPIVCGDLDGDGLRDILWGSTNVAALGNINAGAIGAVSSATGAPIYTVFGTRVNESRVPILAIPDDNGDGIGDFISNGYLPNLNHELQWHSGATGAVYRTVVPTNFGAAIANPTFRPAGDVNADGVPDHAYYSGTIPGRVIFFDNSGTELLRFEDAPTESDGLVSDGADLDGDGSSEVVLQRISFVPLTSRFVTIRTGPFLPSIAARTIIDPISGSPIEPLLINGQGGGPARRVDVPQGTPFAMSMYISATSPLPFILFGSFGFPTAAAATTLPLGLGTMTITPQPLAPTAFGLFVLVNTYSPGTAVLGGPFAPWSATFGAPNQQVSATFQGIVLDPLSPSPTGLSLTNAIAIDVY